MDLLALLFVAFEAYQYSLVIVVYPGLLLMILRTGRVRNWLKDVICDLELVTFAKSSVLERNGDSGIMFARAFSPQVIFFS